MSISVNCPFCGLIDGADTDSLFRMALQRIGHITEGLAGIDSLPLTQFLDVCAAALYGIQPSLLTFFAWVPFNNKGDVVVFIAFLHENADILRTIIPGVKADQQWLVRQLAAKADGLPQEIRRFLLAVPFPRSQFKVDKVAFCPDISHDRCVAVKPLICTGDVFLVRAGAVKRRHVNVNGHIAISKCGRFDMHFAEHVNICLLYVPTQGIPDHVKPLAQRFHFFRL